MTRPPHLVFKEPGSPSFVLHSPHADRGSQAAVLDRTPETEPRELQVDDNQALPDLLVESAGKYFEDSSLDVTRICHRHKWASLPIPVISGMNPPCCDLCEAERLAVDGRSRYRDVVAKRAAGVL